MKEKKYKLIEYILIFMTIYLSSSFYALSISGTINITFSIFIAILCIIINFKKIKINKNASLYFLFIISSSMITLILNSDSIYNYLIFWIYLICSYSIFLCIDIKKFIYIYTDIMYFLSIFSLITFLLLLLVPNLFNIFPYVKNNSGLVIRNVIFSVVYNSSYFNSNFGLFWEPGAYQTFLNLALFFQLFLIRNLNYKRVGILLITIFTTFSTTGYIATIYIIVIFFVRQYTVKKNNYYKNKKINFIFIIILILGAVAFYNMPDVIKFKVLGKLEGIFNTHLLETNSSYESTLARINSFKIPIINLMKSPIWGVGFTNLSNSSKVIGSGFLTSTPLNWFALFGLVSGFIINMPIVMWTSFIKRNYILRIFLILFLIIIILSENYNRNMFFLILCFYGFDVKNAYYNY